MPSGSRLIARVTGGTSLLQADDGLERGGVALYRARLPFVGRGLEAGHAIEAVLRGSE